MDNQSTYYLKPVHIESQVQICPKILESSRKFSKIDVEVFHAGSLVGKALITAQMIEG